MARRWVILVSALVLLRAGAPAVAYDRLVANQSQFLAAVAASKPGDSIVLANGVWQNLYVNFTINGTAAAPIRIRAQTPGQVVLTGPNMFFNVAGSNYVVSGLTFKDQNDNLKAIRFKGTGARVHDNVILDSGRYNQTMWDVQDTAANPTSSFDHNFIAGKQDRGTALVLDGSLYPQIHHNFFGHRPTGGPSGQTNGWETIRIGNSGIMTQTIGANIHSNYFEYAEGEEETISDKTQNNRIHDNTFQNIRKGWVTARHGGNSVYERNFFLETRGIRVGNNEDTIADHPGLVIRDNYFEGSNAKILLPGRQTQVTIERNTVVATAGGFLSSSHTSGKFPLEYTNTTGGVINDNVFVIDDAGYYAVQAGTANSVAPTAVGSGNFAWNLKDPARAFTTSTPTAIRNLFTAANPNLTRDADGILRPTGAAAGKGYQVAGAMQLTRNSDVGPSWLDPVMRLNKSMQAEFSFDGDLASGVTTATAHNSGYLVTPAAMKDSGGAAANLHSAGGLGVSGAVFDRAFDNRATAGMGSATSGQAAVADRTWFRDLQAFTIQGWFKTDGAQSIGGGAVLVQQTDASGGWSLASTTSGRLTLTLNDGTTARTVTSGASYGQQDQWVFFAVTFDQRPSSNEVTFYVGTEAADVTTAGTGSASTAFTSDAVRADVVIGKGFDGLIDNVRLFTARKDVTWTDEDGSVYTRAGNNHDYAILSLEELRTVRAFDLSPRGAPGPVEWSGAAAGMWSAGANWSAGIAPSAGAAARFAGAARAVTVDTPQTVATLYFDTAAGAYSLSGSATLTVTESIIVNAGSHSVSAGLVTPSPVAIRIESNASLDLVGNALWVAEPLPAIREHLRTARLRSSVAAADPQHRLGLGYSPDGWVELTYLGDANLDGRITADDFALLDRGAATGGTFWWEGDFNYDGVVSSADFLLIDRVYFQQGNPMSAMFVSAREAQFGTAYVSELLASMPEPSVVAGVVAFLPRVCRRRNRS